MKSRLEIETLPGAITILRFLAHCFVQRRWETGSCPEIIWVSTIHHHRPMNPLSPSLFVSHRVMWPVLEGPWPLLLLLQLLLLQPLYLMTITKTIVATRTILGWVLDASKMAHGSSVSSYFFMCPFCQHGDSFPLGFELSISGRSCQRLLSLHNNNSLNPWHLFESA